jgi:23S rRNA pseudouridine1911/1915/1917 synthase
MDQTRRFVVDRGDARRRLDRVLLDRLPQAKLSRTRIQRWVEEGRVRVGEAVVARPATRVLEGQPIEVRVPVAPRPTHVAEPIALRVLHEDDWLLAVDKPAGMVVHPTRRYPRATLVNALLWHCRDETRAGYGPRLAHRLDRDTSGVLLVAKSREVHAALARAMARRAAIKDYVALVYGTPPVDRDLIDLRIARDAETGGLVVSKTQGRACSTRYELLARSAGARAGLSLLRCTLGTGRLHQIRVHLAGIGLPIVGDPRYGSPRWKGLADEACARACAAFPRQALHAHRLRVVHPVTGAALDLEAPLPDDFRSLLDATGMRAGAAAEAGTADTTLRQPTV